MPNSVSMHEDHIRAPTPEETAAGAKPGRCGALGPLPAGYPTPEMRIVLRDIKILAVLCTEDGGVAGELVKLGLFESRSRGQSTWVGVCSMVVWLFGWRSNILAAMV